MRFCIPENDFNPLAPRRSQTGSVLDDLLAYYISIRWLRGGARLAGIFVKVQFVQFQSAGSAEEPDFGGEELCRQP